VRSLKCFQCEGFNEKITIKYPYEYFNLVEQLKEILEQRTLLLLDGNCDLNDLKSGNPYPNDYIYHIFKCSKCNSKYKLAVETYHGTGGKWDFYEK
jgi:hypothetical protein